ncbi:MAG: hypothetical protein C0594_04645 [Marinilabiliales bacterium]|nr:MAG: hypothetical protein C0594_04645 [Marinilabiliales bacterium]
MAFNVNEWLTNILKGDVVYSYVGQVSSDLITQALDEIEYKLEQDGVNPKMIRKVYNVLIECLQNLFHHSLKDVEGVYEGDRFGAFKVVVNDTGYVVATGNYVKNEIVQVLKDRIEQINSLSREEIKSLYKMILNNEEFSAKGGGGLGMIDIAKRTGSRLGYEFHQIDKKYSFYNLNIYISS